MIGATAYGLIHITWGLVVLKFKPVCLAKVVQSFSLLLQMVMLGGQNSWNIEKRVHWMFLGLSAVVLHMIQLMATSKSIGEMIQCFCTSDLKGRYENSVGN